jgi:hypothetical protein
MKWNISIKESHIVEIVIKAEASAQAETTINGVF